MKRFNQGFTLTELMVTVAIIVVLTAIILPNFTGARAKARDAQRVSDVGQIQGAIHLYYDRCGQFPDSLSITASNGCPAGASLSTYIGQMPTPPGGGSYDYSTLSTGGKVINYVIHTLLEQTNAAATKGYVGMPPSGLLVWSVTLTCAPPLNYCLTSN